jgi:hypothetical protein
VIDGRSIRERRTGGGRRTNDRRVAYLFPIKNERRSGLDRRLYPRRIAALERRA